MSATVAVAAPAAEAWTGEDLAALEAFAAMHAPAAPAVVLAAFRLAYAGTWENLTAWAFAALEDERAAGLYGEDEDRTYAEQWVDAGARALDELRAGGAWAVQTPCGSAVFHAGANL